MGYHYVYENPDLSNKVDSVDCKAVECALLRVWARYKPSIRPSVKTVWRQSTLGINSTTHV